MADGEEEQFSLCWNNYNTNLSTGFHESLCRGDLVDVTLAAEGQLVKAHRLVLSVCSPYFQKMFTQMPANQHAFVFLKDVPHAALKDLIQFMYCGEVNVKQDALPTFISTAEALQIKGLTENGDSTSAPSQTPSSATHVPIKATSTPANVVQTQRPRTVQQRNIGRTTSYKLDSEDSSDDKASTVVVQQTQKRVLPRPGAAQGQAKRLKTISDPLEQSESPRSVQSSSAQQGPSAQIVQVTSAAEKTVGEPEFIDLPIETLPTKAEPDYGDEGEVEEAGDTEATYVEDESYGDMKYDESYFTESEETAKGASASGFGESYTEGDTSANEAQDIRPFELDFEASVSMIVSPDYLLDSTELNLSDFTPEKEQEKEKRKQPRRAAKTSKASKTKKLIAKARATLKDKEKVADTLPRKIIIHKGNKFYCDSQSDRKLIWKCSTSRFTNCTASLTTNLKCSKIIAAGTHDHANNTE